jgi:hypothetical protein
MEVVDKTHLLRENPLDSSYAASIADLDADGVPEVFVTTADGPNHLYKMTSECYLDVASPILQDAEHSALAVAAGDVTGNGLLDLYVLNAGTFMGPLAEPDRLFVNQGDLRFTDMMESHPDRNIGAGRSICWTDPMATGHLGLYVVNYGAPNKLFVNDGEGGFRNQAPVAHGLGLISGGRSVVSQDILGSGRMDMFVLNEDGPNVFFRNTPGGYIECAEMLGLQDPNQNGRGLQACDFNRDGRIDLVYANWEGPHRIFQQRPEGDFLDVASSDFAHPSRARSIVVADFDNDGWEDVFINNMGEPNRLFRNLGDGTFEEVDPGPLLLPDGTGTGVSCGDLDLDGWLELFVCHGELMPQRNRIFSVAPNGNSWLRILPLSMAGAPAIGARVTLQFDRPMIRFIDGGSGYLCQMEPIAHFGLGSERTVPRVHVRWSDGAEVHLDGVEPNRVIKVPHPRTHACI